MKSTSEVLRPITPRQEAGLEPVGWSWERDGGMCNCFPYRTSWDFERPERNEYWIAKGFTASRPLFLQTPLQKAAPELLAALRKYEAAFEGLFAQCCSNPITDAWGKQVDTTLLNEAHELARAAIKAQGGAQ